MASRTAKCTDGGGMCGRFSLTTNIRKLQARGGFEAAGLDYSPRQNIALTQQVLAVRSGGAETARQVGHRTGQALGRQSLDHPTGGEVVVG